MEGREPEAAEAGRAGELDAALKKPGRLTLEEFAEMRGHPEAGARILRNVPSLAPAALWVRHHHEYFDGSGRPDGLRGSSIPLGARIILAADASTR